MSYDPMVRVAWAERPSGPLSNLYLTSEQTDAVYDWLDDVIARVREDTAARNYNNGFDDGYAAALRDAVDMLKTIWRKDTGAACSDYLLGLDDAVAAIEFQALGGNDGD